MSADTPNHYLLINSMIEYLDPKYNMAHTAQLRDELACVLARIHHQNSILEALLASPTYIPLSMLEIYLENVGHKVLGEMTDWDDDPVSPISTKTFEGATPQERRRLFKILEDYTDQTLLKRTTSDLVAIAILDNDHDFLDWLENRLNIGQDVILSTVVSKSVFEEAGIDALPMVERLFDNFDPAAPRWADLCTMVVHRNLIRTAALLMTRGWNPRPALEAGGHSSSSGTWSARFLHRLNTSSHAELKLIASIPPQDQIMRMSVLELKHLLAGPSGREQKKIDKERRREEQRQYFVDRNLPIPEGLKKES